MAYFYRLMLLCAGLCFSSIASAGYLTNPVPPDSWECSAYPSFYAPKNQIWECKTGKADDWRWVKGGAAFRCPSGHTWNASGWDCIPPPQCTQPAGAVGFKNADIVWRRPDPVTTSTKIPSSYCGGDNCMYHVTKADGGYTYAVGPEAMNARPPVANGVGWKNATSETSGDTCIPGGSWTNDGFAGHPPTAAPSTDSPPDDDPNSCGAKGGSFGQVNNVWKCVPGRTNGTTDGSGNPTPGPNGTEIQQTSEKSVDNGDGTTTEITETTETSCVDGQCTKTVTRNEVIRDNATGNIVKDADGNPQVKTEKTGGDEKKDSKTFCQENPSSSVCKNGSWSATNCDTPPACDGDAVQCATARNTWDLKCALGGDAGDPSAKLGNDLASGNDSLLSGDGNPYKRGIVNVGDSITVTNSGIAASCPADTQVTFHGHTFAIPWSQVCPYISKFGYAVLAFAWLIALRTVRGAF